MERDELIEALCKATYAMWQAVLNGGRYNEELFREMNDFKIGDLVMEISSIGFCRDRKNYGDKIGHVVETGPSRYIHGEKAVSIRKLIDGELIDWDNCKFIRVPGGECITRPFERKEIPGIKKHADGLSSLSSGEETRDSGPDTEIENECLKSNEEQ